MMNFKEILLLPINNFKEFVLGVILFALSELILPSLFALGYVIKVYQKAQKMEDELPAWDMWFDLGKKGIVSIIIVSIYLLPALIFLFFSLILITLKIQLVGLLTLVLAVIFLLLGAFILPLVLFQYSKTEKIVDAFNFFVLFALLKGKVIGHLLRFGALIIIGVPFSLILILLRYVLEKGLVLDVVATIVTAISQFFILIIMAETFGRLYTDVKKKEVEKLAPKPSDKHGGKASYCPRCGTKIIKKGKYCVNCGNKL